MSSKKHRKKNSSAHHYDPENFVIPRRVSSLIPAARQTQIESLDETLKRKASQLSQSLKTASSREFLGHKRQCLDLEDEKYKVLYKGLRESFAKKELKEKVFQDLVKQCFESRAKLAQESVTIARNQQALEQNLSQEDMASGPDMEAAYANLLPLFYRQHEQPAGFEIRSDAKHREWKEDLRIHYNSFDSTDNELLWCPIMQRYAPSGSRTAAHIVPHALGFRNVGFLFGEPDNGFDLLWSVRNGITMASILEKDFDRGDFVLVPVPSDPGSPTEWKLVLINEKKKKYPVGDSELKYEDLERPLVWKNDERPGARYLYYHFVATILRYQKYEKPGWAETRLQLPTGRIWATPGPYLKRSTLKKLGEYLGDREADKTFGEGAFEGEAAREEDENLAVRDIASLDFETHEGKGMDG